MQMHMFFLGFFFCMMLKKYPEDLLSGKGGLKVLPELFYQGHHTSFKAFSFFFLKKYF